ncbi:MAG: hypothetical protein ACOX5R_18880 [bacterium]|jgi:hypothetical protein
MKSDRSELGKTLVLVGEWTLILLLFLAGIYLQQDEVKPEQRDPMSVRISGALDVNNVSFQTFLHVLQGKSGMVIIQQKPIRDLVSVRFEDFTVREVLNYVCYMHNLEYHVDKNMIVRIAPKPKPAQIASG